MRLNRYCLNLLVPSSQVNYQGDIQTATGEEYPQQFATVSLDGYLNFWDLRFKKDLKSLDLAWKPTFRVPLSPLDSDVEFGLTKLSLCYKASEEKVVKEKTEGGENKENAGDRSGNAVKVKGSTDIDKDTEKALVLSSKFFCATEEGDLIVCDWSSHRKDKEEKSRRGVNMVKLVA